MEITVTSVETRQDRQMFATKDRTLRVAYLSVEGHTFGVSQWEGEKVWMLDSHIGDDGMPHYVHGEGSRECDKYSLSILASKEVDARFAEGSLTM